MLGDEKPTLISMGDVKDFHGGPYYVQCTRSHDPGCDPVVEAEICYEGIAVRSIIGSEKDLPLLLLHAINDHQRSLAG